MGCNTVVGNLVDIDKDDAVGVERGWACNLRVLAVETNQMNTSYFAWNGTENDT